MWEFETLIDVIKNKKSHHLPAFSQNLYITFNLFLLYFNTCLAKKMKIM
jgi:hypothetical protein